MGGIPERTVSSRCSNALSNGTTEPLVLVLSEVLGCSPAGNLRSVQFPTRYVLALLLTGTCSGSVPRYWKSPSSCVDVPSLHSVVCNHRNIVFATKLLCFQANIELDRAMAAAEAGFRVGLMKVRQPKLTTKSDVIVGVPAELCPAKFRWPWKQ